MTQYSLWKTGARGGDNDKLVYWQCALCKTIFQNDDDGEKHILESHIESTLIPKLNQHGLELWDFQVSIPGNESFSKLSESEKLANMGYFSKVVNQETSKLPKDYIGREKKDLALYL